MGLTRLQSFQGGAIGIQLHNQQYQLKGLSFNACTVGISISTVFTATIQGATFQNCDFGVDMGNVGSAGAVSLVDSSISSCNAAVQAPITNSGQNSLVIDGLTISDSTKGVKAPNGNILLSGGVPAGETWVLGNLWVK